jgi:2',3'-cyclic-nucleotide 2'-phosphodiesterase (5'-nucleotidase family)
VNIGARDVRAGYPEFTQRIAGSKLEFVSANIVRQDTQQPVFKPRVMIEVPGGKQGKQKIKVGLVGVVRFNPLFLKPGPGGANLVIAHPVERVRQEVEALRGEGAQVIVLLAALHKDDATRIVEAVPGIDFVLGAYGGVFSPAAERVGQSWVAYSGNKGQRIGETRVFLDAERHVSREQTRMHFLTPIYPANRTMLDFVNAVPIQATQEGHAGQGAEGGR